MQGNSRFAIALHVLALLSGDDPDKSSERLAGSIGVNAVVVRGVIGRLRRANLVATRPGAPGAQLTRPTSQITLADIFSAVEDDRSLFGIHPRPNARCPIGGAITKSLRATFDDARGALLAQLGSVTLACWLDTLAAKIAAPEIAAPERV